MTQCEVAVLMAVYNGGRYIREQIESLMRQSFSDFTLYIHDDGSTDDTMSVVDDLVKKYDNIVVIYYESQHGAKDNFLSLLQKVDAEYYLFCDQDDVWHEDKIKIQMEAMKSLEKKYPDKPVEVFSDLYIVDSDLNITGESLWQYNAIYPEFLTTFDELGASNAATGCTILINRKAKDCIVFPADKATMHDAWTTLCVARSGGILHPIRKKLVYYRQHSDNAIGAVDAAKVTISYRLRHLSEIFRKNKETFAMLSALGYGSVFKFIRYKIRYRNRIKEKNLQR